MNYLAVATRPDLAFVVGFLARFTKSPTKRHWAAVQHALDYIKSKGCQELVIKPEASNVDMLTWVDANW
ncbi:hypothetical protein ACFYE4_15425, partial [Kocuria sp. CPCC 205295]|uniref:hypothetical protein n=1 Tax=Kocuria sp. CPCC 205295 TaxID=3073557 RepID=UPI0036DEEDF5